MEHIIFNMKKIFLIIILFILPNVSHAKLNVVTTTSNLSAIASYVGGNLISVKALARGDQDPHFLEPKPSFVAAVGQADLLISVGLELEIGWLPVLVTQSRNPKIQKGSAGYMEASDGIPLLELPTGIVDRSMGDVHPFGNPHYWLNPNNGLIIADHMAKKFSELDPTNAATYQMNADQFKAALKTKITTWNQELASLRGKQIITYHKSLSYFMDWADLKQAGYLEPKPGIHPSPSHILELVDTIEKQKVPLIVSENYYDPKPAQELAKKTGVKHLVLATSVGGDTGTENYFTLFDYLVSKFTENLK